jgi:tetratricopeptide (TPR) repeat protein
MTELMEIAILAYRNARYRDAIELLLQVTDSAPDSWLGRLYLGMAYEKTGRVADAFRAFKRISTDCPEANIKVKAENALPMVEAEMKRRFKKETAIVEATKKAYNDEELVWVAVN